MKPQHQTTFGNGKNGREPGNCFAACIASILEVPLTEVPNFCATPEWVKELNLWLFPRGFFYVDFRMAEDCPPEEVFCWAGYHVISGDGPRGCRHSVVGRAGKIVHDPHPSGAGLLTEEEYGFLIPLDPAAIGQTANAV